MLTRNKRHTNHRRCHDWHYKIRYCTGTLQW